MGGPIVGVLVGSGISALGESRRWHRDRSKRERDELRQALRDVVRAGVTFMTAEGRVRPYRRPSPGKAPIVDIAALAPERRQRVEETIDGLFDLATEVAIAVTALSLVKANAEVVRTATAWKDSILAIRTEDSGGDNFETMYEEAGRRMQEFMSANASYLNAADAPPKWLRVRGVFRWPPPGPKGH